jgi:hypothetical protein
LPSLARTAGQETGTGERDQKAYDDSYTATQLVLSALRASTFPDAVAPESERSEETPAQATDTPSPPETASSAETDAAGQAMTEYVGPAALIDKADLSTIDGIPKGVDPDQFTAAKDTIEAASSDAGDAPDSPKQGDGIQSVRRDGEEEDHEASELIRQGSRAAALDMVADGHELAATKEGSPSSMEDGETADRDAAEADAETAGFTPTDSAEPDPVSAGADGTLPETEEPVPLETDEPPKDAEDRTRPKSEDADPVSEPARIGAGASTSASKGQSTELPSPAHEEPGTESEELEGEDDEPQTEDLWLWVDPRQEIGYDPQSFDVASFLQRAIARFQSKSWSGGKKPTRLAANPIQEPNGLKPAAEALGLELVEDALVPAQTYRLGMAQQDS